MEPDIVIIRTALANDTKQQMPKQKGVAIRSYNQGFSVRTDGIVAIFLTH